MEKLWKLRGKYDAPGWGPLERDARSDAIDVLCFDRGGWALVRADEAPTKYEGLAPEPAPAGLYLDDYGHALYVAGGRSVQTAEEVVASLGGAAVTLLEHLGDADSVLERLGYAY